MRANGRLGRIILIDAAACFLAPATVRAMLQRLAHGGCRDPPRRQRGPSDDEPRPGLAAAEQSVRSAVDLGDLIHLLQRDGRPDHWRFATLPAVGAGEQPLRDVAGIYAGARAARTDAALRLVEAGLGLRDPGRIELRGNLTFGRNVFHRRQRDHHWRGHFGRGRDNRAQLYPGGCAHQGRQHGQGILLSGGCARGPRLPHRAVCAHPPGHQARPRLPYRQLCGVKNTTFGRNCKINHNSFVGDAVIGNDVIMGAGSMTCNFDGTKSNVTIIRNKAFIGSGVMLVAPVTVERNAFVGAGSTSCRQRACQQPDPWAGQTDFHQGMEEEIIVYYIEMKIPKTT